ncbi:hypothetical protein ACFQH6_14410 [Halobacteriaceae archaeon GCM10025711]
MTAIEWSRTPANARLARLPLYAFVGFLGGMGLLAMALLVRVALAGLDLAQVGLVVLLVFVGGPLSLLYLWPMLSDPDQRPSLPGPGVRHLHPAWVAVAVLVAAGLLVVAARSGVWLLVALAAGLMVPPVATNLLTTEGTLDPAAGTVTLQGRSISLDSLAGVRRWHVGDTAVCWLSYGPGAGGAGAPYLLVLPKDVAAAIADAVGGDESTPD